MLAESASGYYLLTAFPELVGHVVPLLRESRIKYVQQARGESVAVQTKTEKWLRTEDETFMLAYYHAKSKAIKSKTLDLSWLSDYAGKHFKAGHQVMFDII